MIHCGDAFGFLGKLPDESVDLIVCDGPYGTTAHAWDRIPNIQEFNLGLIRIFSRVLRAGASAYLFGKPDCVDFIDYRPYLSLRNRIVWYQPSRLAQGRLAFTNNYDIICHFVKGAKPRIFNLESIRVPQLVELEHRLRCERVPSVVNGRFGKTKFNDKGKNPGDVWGDIKQLTYKSKELVDRRALNTIQKPERLIERLVLASSNAGDVVLDPFCGVGTTAVVCEQLSRNFIAFELNSEFVAISNERLCRARAKEALFDFSGNQGDIPQDHQTCA